MSGRITSSPQRQHHCNAGWHVESDEAMKKRLASEHPAGFPHVPFRVMIEDRPWPEPGAIWTCDDCGRQWKATYPYDNVFAPTWVCYRPIKPIRWPWRKR